MDRDTFDTMQQHYSNKLIEISDNIDEIHHLLIEAKIIVEDSWKGLSGSACDEQIENTKNELQKAGNDISDAISALSDLEIIDDEIIE